MQIDYSNYREIDGVKVPEQWTLARPGGQFTIQIDEIDQKQAIADSKFAEPSAAPASGTAGHNNSQ